MSGAVTLLDEHCVHGAPALDAAALPPLLGQVPAWHVVDGTRLERRFAFRNFHETMEFINAMAWIVHREDHHPDILAGYNACRLQFTTHSAGNALSHNDFICAARIDALFAGPKKA